MKKCYKCADTRLQHGYYEDYLKSKEITWLSNEQFENGDGLGFIGCVRRCHCNPEADAKQRLLRAKLPEKFLNQKFDRKKTSSQDHAIRVLYDAVQSTVANQKTLSFVKGVCLYGPTGTGKTTLLCQTLANITQKTELDVLFLDFKEHIERVKKNFSSEEKDSYIDDIKNIQVLFIDDLSAGRQSAFDIDYIETLINYRYNNALPLFFTTNLSSNDLFGKTPILSHRTISRLQEMCSFIKVEGEDIRKFDKKVITFKKEMSL